MTVPPTPTVPPTSTTSTMIHVSPLDTDIIWAGTDDGNVWVTDDGGANWNPVNPSGPAYWVTDSFISGFMLVILQTASM